MYLDVLDHLCLRVHSNLYTIPTSIPLLATGKSFGVTLQTVFMSFDLNRGQLESLMGKDQGIPVQNIFKKWRILPLQSQYTLSLSLFVMNNENLFHCNSEIHGFNTRQSSNLHEPQANLSLYQKVAYYSGIKVFDSLPPPSQHKKLIFNSAKS